MSRQLEDNTGTLDLNGPTSLKGFEPLIKGFRPLRESYLGPQVCVTFALFTPASPKTPAA